MSEFLTHEAGQLHDEGHREGVAAERERVTTIVLAEMNRWLHSETPDVCSEREASLISCGAVGAAANILALVHGLKFSNPLKEI